MAFFGIGKKKGILQQAQRGTFTNVKEREEVIRNLKELKPSASEAVGLLWSRDSTVRQIGVEAFLSKPDQASIKAMVYQMVDRPSHVKAFALRMIPKLDRRMVEKVVDACCRTKAPRASGKAGSWAWR